MTAAETLVIFPDMAGWLRIADGAIVARGAGALTSPGADTAIALVVAASDVALHPADIAGLAPAQAQAAARLIAAEVSIAPVDALHVVAGECIAVIAQQRMADLLGQAQAQGLDPHIMIPAPLLLPEPAEGLVCGQVGDEAVVRGRGAGFADDPALTPLIAAGAAVESADGAALDQAIIAGVAFPALNLRQGAFARRRDWSVDRKRLSWAARIFAAIGVIGLIIPLATIIRLNQQSAAYEMQAGLVAQAALGGSATANAPAQLDEALARLRGGGAGFLPTAHGVIAAVERIPNVELSTMAFEDDGSLRVSARASSAAELTALQQAIRAAGFVVTAGAITGNQGQPVSEIKVRGQ